LDDDRENDQGDNVHDFEQNGEHYSQEREVDSDNESLPESSTIKKGKMHEKNVKSKNDRKKQLNHDQNSEDDANDLEDNSMPESSKKVVKKPKKIGSRSKSNDNINLKRSIKDQQRSLVRVPISAPTDNEDGSRRSGRNRIEPVAFWKNEKAVFDRRESGIHIVEVIRARSPEPSMRPFKSVKPKSKIKEEEKLLPIPIDIPIINYKTKQEEFQSTGLYLF
jgi:centromere protein C